MARFSEDCLCHSCSQPEAAKVLVSIMVVWLAKGKKHKLRHYDIRRAHFQGTGQTFTYVCLPAEDRHVMRTTQGRLVKGM